MKPRFTKKERNESEAIRARFGGKRPSFDELIASGEVSAVSMPLSLYSELSQAIDRLAAARKEAGHSRTLIARRMGVEAEIVREIEQKRRIDDVAILSRYAEALGLTLVVQLRREPKGRRTAISPSG